MDCAIEIAARWAARMAEDDVGMPERLEFNAWLQRDPANLSLYMEYSNLWDEPEMAEAAARVFARSHSKT